MWLDALAVLICFLFDGSHFQAGTRTLDIEFTTLLSTHHVAMNPADAGFQDRDVVQVIIKEMSKNRALDAKGKKGFKGKIVVWAFKVR